MRGNPGCWLLLLVVLLTAGCATTSPEQYHWRGAESLDTIEAYEKLLKQYPEGLYAAQARARLAELYWEQAKGVDTIKSYEGFLRRYAKSMFAGAARERLEELSYQRAKTEDTIATYERFLRRYPESMFAGAAWERLEELSYQRAKTEDTASDYRKFLETYPESEFTAQVRKRISELEADAAIFARAKSRDTVDAYREFIEEYPENRFVDQARRALRIKLAPNVLGTEIMLIVDEVRTWKSFDGHFPSEAAYDHWVWVDSWSSTIESYAEEMPGVRGGFLELLLWFENGDDTAMTVFLDKDENGLDVGLILDDLKELSVKAFRIPEGLGTAFGTGPVMRAGTKTVAVEPASGSPQPFSDRGGVDRTSLIETFTGRLGFRLNPRQKTWILLVFDIPEECEHALLRVKNSEPISVHLQ